MRYVDIARLRLPTGWLDRATAATEAVARGDSVEDHSAIWRELKDELANLMPEKKCWYCESPSHRSDNAVDHFRPKGRVADADRAHDGYKWLAFDWNNFRYSCTFCNSRRIGVNTAGGKGDRFPLLNESDRLYSQGDVTVESPTLLDPCEIDDWKLLGCRQENGSPCPASNDSTQSTRVLTSIEILHLDYEPTSKTRHGVAVQLLADVDHAKRLFERSTQDASVAPDFKNAAKKVRRHIDRAAPYSGEMIFLLKGQRSSEHPWIQDLIEA